MKIDDYELQVNRTKEFERLKSELEYWTYFLSHVEEADKEISIESQATQRIKGIDVGCRSSKTFKLDKNDRFEVLQNILVEGAKKKIKDIEHQMEQI